MTGLSGASGLLVTLALGATACTPRSTERSKATSTAAPSTAAPSTSAPSTSAPSPRPRRVTLPDGISAIGADGLKRLVRQHGGAGTLVNVWASFCGSCKAEMPMLLALREEYERQGLALLLVSVDAPQDAASALTTLQQLGAPTPGLLVGESLQDFKAKMSPLWKGSLPASFLFDATGTLRYFWGAQVFEQELRPVLDAFLRGDPVDGAANFSVRKSPG